MKKIDLEQSDYRRKPRKGEPFFMPGAGKRVMAYSIAFVFVFFVSVAAWFLVYQVIKPSAEGWYCSTTSNC